MSSQGTALLVALLVLAGAASAEPLDLGRSVVMRAAAVAETPDGFVGSAASITITSAANGSGHVFLDTFPLTELDMQGSARLAARVASQLAGKSLAEHDFFFVIRSGAQQIGGPSAGATLAVGAIAALNGWEVRPDALMTGTINPDGTVGPVGGIPEKAAAAAQIGMTRFLYPAGQELYPLGAGQVLNMTTYCREELAIECHPVVDVVQAVGLMTDHAFERPDVTGNVTGESYLGRLGPLSGELVAGAERLAREATEALGRAPEGNARAALAQRLAGAEGYLATAEEERPAVAQKRLDEASGVVARVRGSIEARPVRDMSTLESVGAAQVRILEAEDRLARAHELLLNATSPGDVFGAIYEAAYASERAETAAWWLRLSEGFPAGQPVDEQGLADIARDAITTSAEEIAYVEAVFSGASLTGILAEPQEKLADAELAVARGYHAAAMLEAFEASVRASVLLEVLGFQGAIPASKFETARVEAARAIQGARERGVESFLAQSAYEFGLSLDDPQERLAFLGLARVTGNIAGLPGLFGGAHGLESRFQGVPETIGVQPVYIAAAFAIGLALGAGAGLTALMPRQDEDDELPGPPAEPPLARKGLEEEGREGPPRPSG